MTILGPSLWKQLLCATSRLNPSITLGPQDSSVVLKESTMVAAFGRRQAAVAGQGATAPALGQATTQPKGGKVFRGGSFCPGSVPTLCLACCSQRCVLLVGTALVQCRHLHNGHANPSDMHTSRLVEHRKVLPGPAHQDCLSAKPRSETDCVSSACLT